jgi:hypothetical protein
MSHFFEGGRLKEALLRLVPLQPRHSLIILHFAPLLPVAPTQASLLPLAVDSEQELAILAPKRMDLSAIELVAPLRPHQLVAAVGGPAPPKPAPSEESIPFGYSILREICLLQAPCPQR